MTGGTFNVARSIWEHPVFSRGEFSEREAFLWLVSEAAWKPRTVRVAAYVTDLERGQLCASVRFMAEAWGWSKSRVGRFLAKLRESDMIKNRDSSGTAPLVITVCNYDKFQGQRDSAETKAGQQRDSSGTNEKKDNSREERNTPPTPRKRGETGDPDFEAFWSAYPRKVAKPAALKAWRAAVKKSDPATIIAAAPKAGDGGQFTPHPSTWLNQERWKDAPTSGPKTGWASVDEYLEDSGIYDFDDPRHALNRRRARDGSGNPKTCGHRGPRSDELPDDMPGVFSYTPQEARRVPVGELV